MNPLVNAFHVNPLVRNVNIQLPNVPSAYRITHMDHMQPLKLPWSAKKSAHLELILTKNKVCALVVRVLATRA